jgi:copper resistance protein D
MLDALAAVARCLLYAGTLSSAGVVFADATLRRAAVDQVFLRRIVRNGALVTIVSAIAGAFLLILRLGGQFDEATLAAVFATSAGAALCLQLAGAGLLLASDFEDDSQRVMRIGTAALLLTSFAFGGHAAVAGPAPSIVAFVHVGVASWWVGSLWLLHRACSSTGTDGTRALVARFSTIATIMIGALVIAGLILIGVLVDFAALPEILPYVQILAIKLCVVAVVLGAAAYNRLRLTPRLLAGESAAVRALQRMIRAELGLVGAILAVTAVLTTYTSPHV